MGLRFHRLAVWPSHIGILAVYVMPEGLSRTFGSLSESRLPLTGDDSSS